MIRRFSRLRIFEHWGVVLSTLILFATGLSQRFWHLDFSQWLILKMGGIHNVRWIHRYAGVFFSFELILNVATAVAGVVRGRRSPSMFLAGKDFRDAVETLKTEL